MSGGGGEEDERRSVGFSTSEHTRRIEEIEALQGRIPLRLPFKGALSHDERRLLAQFIADEIAEKRSRRKR